MSTLKVDQVLDSKGSQTNPPSIPGLNPQLCKAWVNINGVGTLVMRAQYNVSGVTDNGPGDYTVNLTSSLDNINFAVVMTASDGNANAAEQFTFRTTSSIRTDVRTANTSTGLDVSSVNVAIFAN